MKELVELIEEGSEKMGRTHPDVLLCYVRYSECLEWKGEISRAKDILATVVEFERIRGKGQFQEMAMIFLDLILLFEKKWRLENAA